MQWLRDDEVAGGWRGGAMVVGGQGRRSRGRAMAAGGQALRIHVSLEARHPAAIALTLRQGASFKGSQSTARVRKPLKETCFMVGRLPRCRGGSTRAVETSPTVVNARLCLLEIP